MVTEITHIAPPICNDGMRVEMVRSLSFGWRTSNAVQHVQFKS
jgi:hypothetical protein